MTAGTWHRLAMNVTRAPSPAASVPPSAPPAPTPAVTISAAVDGAPLFAGVAPVGIDTSLAAWAGIGTGGWGILDSGDSSSSGPGATLSVLFDNFEMAML